MKIHELLFWLQPLYVFCALCRVLLLSPAKFQLNFISSVKNVLLQLLILCFSGGEE